MTDQTSRPGTFILHRSGDVAQIRERKQDRSGWWLEDGGGIADSALAGPDWVILDRRTLTALFGDADPPTDTELVQTFDDAAKTVDGGLGLVAIATGLRAVYQLGSAAKNSPAS